MYEGVVIGAELGTSYGVKIEYTIEAKLLTAEGYYSGILECIILDMNKRT